eukprot:15419342-Alexandrium_andersonii.AAC.1
MPCPGLAWPAQPSPALFAPWPALAWPGLACPGLPWPALACLGVPWPALLGPAVAASACGVRV